LAMVGMLAAVPKTPLFERLKKENRLRLDDTNCNIVPKQMTPAQLQQGYWKLLHRLYTPQAFLDRYFKIYQYPEFRRRRKEMFAKANENNAMQALGYGLILWWNLFWALLKDGSLKQVGGVYLRYFFKQTRRYQRGVFGFAQFMNRCVTHWHFYRFTREGTAGRLRLFNSG
jgi:hypothetical protein